MRNGSLPLTGSTQAAAALSLLSSPSWERPQEPRAETVVEVDELRVRVGWLFVAGFEWRGLGLAGDFVRWAPTWSAIRFGHRRDAAS